MKRYYSYSTIVLFMLVLAFTTTNSFILKGTITDEQGTPLAGASIYIKGTNRGTSSDSTGQFSIEVPGIKSILVISTVGHGSIEVEVRDNKPVAVVLKRAGNSLQEVVITGYSSQSIAGRAPGIRIRGAASTRLNKMAPDYEAKLFSKVEGYDKAYNHSSHANKDFNRTVTVRDTANTFIQKVFNNEMFKAYPNPASIGSKVTLTYKKQGNYSVQLFDNSGKLYLQKAYLNTNSKQSIAFQLPANMTSGIYYLKATNITSNKQFVDKLIIQ